MFRKKTVFVAALAFFFLSLFMPRPSALYPEEYENAMPDGAAIDGDLEALGNLLADTLLNAERQEILLEELRQNLDESGALLEKDKVIIAGQEALLGDLQAQLGEMSEIYRNQSLLAAKHEKSSRFYKKIAVWGIACGIVLGGGIGAGIVYAALR